MRLPATELVETGVTRLEVLGVRLEVVVHDPAIAAAVAARLPATARPVGIERPADALVRVEPHGPDRALIVLDGILLHGPNPPGVVADLVAATIDDVVAAEAPSHVLVRGAAVAIGGRAVVLVGESFSGTSTLAAALAERGAIVLADGWVALDGAGAVTPTGARDRPSDEPAGPVPVGVVVSVPFTPDARWEVERTTAVAGAMALMAKAPVARREPARAMATAKAVTAGSVVVTGRRGPAAEAAEHIERLLLDA